MTLWPGTLKTESICLHLQKLFTNLSRHLTLSKLSFVCSATTMSWPPSFYATHKRMCGQTYTRKLLFKLCRDLWVTYTLVHTSHKHTIVDTLGFRNVVGWENCLDPEVWREERSYQEIICSSEILSSLLLKKVSCLEIKSATIENFFSPSS